MLKQNKNSQIFQAQDVEVVERDTVYRGFLRLDTLKLRHRLFAGGWGPEITRELLLRGVAVAVLLYDPKSDRVAFVEQFRVGAFSEEEQVSSPWLLEVVAGLVEEGETPEQVAHRELQEEAGLSNVQLHFIIQYLTSPGASDETVYLYCGVTDLENVEGLYGLENEAEDIRVSTMAAEQAFSALETGGQCPTGYLNNSATIIGLQWLQLNRQRLRAKG